MRKGRSGIWRSSNNTAKTGETGKITTRERERERESNTKREKGDREAIQS